MAWTRSFTGEAQNCPQGVLIVSLKAWILTIIFSTVSTCREVFIAALVTSVSPSWRMPP